ncbi:Lrp/AsnC ligand binding domain-containing protein [Desulforhopalus singaporensis]|uniref:ParB-like nuclease domain-containing protein n=1 Tax=Desulforhopalus singaporensis TaxID=91360 RepID=A0A1H0KQD5_9BACT|nr:Lrp/AsnC ligand binding domain-containing protein [Desulforhopalus singaporensis]SDO58159.1 ParB-like nuclease domain-containing protein [Desulforhopalus singaporensis]
MFSKSKIFSALKKKFSGSAEKTGPHANSFSARQQEEKAYEAIERGTLMVPLDKIVGSVGRYHDFDHQFKDHNPSREKDPRLEGILQAMRKGKNLPAIALYQIKEDFFILDGHHRYQAAKELGHTQIRSKIVELLPSKNSLENNLYLEKTRFRDNAGLVDPLDLTEPGQFIHLEWQISEHRKFLESETGQPVSFQQAAQDWYSTIYRPLFTLIKNSGLINSFPSRTVDDLYLYISMHQWEKGKKRKYGIGIDKLIPTDMEVFRKKMADQKEQEYPEMKREITVFMLLNIEGRHEDNIFQKLLALPEVREIHSVHGAFDILIKITLMRDLLSSDAELISEFTQSTIRQWKGVLSTQTLIPGTSRIKEEDRCLL